MGRASAMAPEASNTNSCNSHAALSLGLWGVAIYRCGIGLALTWMAVVAGLYALSPEPLWARLLSDVVLGIVPASIVYVVGWMLSSGLGIASSVYDPIARRLKLICQALLGVSQVGPFALSFYVVAFLRHN